MKIALLHNTYQIKGGEDSVLEQEKSLLLRNGHGVCQYIVSNDDIVSLFDKLKVFFQSHYSKSTKNKVKAFLEREKPDVVHVHNFFPLLSPSIFDACDELNIPAVMTVHNFRLICPSALLMHKGQTYEKALFRSAYSTIFDKVYRNSLLGTWSVAHMIEYHKKRKTWEKKLSKIICLTEFQKNKFADAGFSTENFCVKPNFRTNDVLGKGIPQKRSGRALFVGRLSHEKGLDLLVEAFRESPYEIDIIGGGKLESLRATAANNIHFCGSMSSEQVQNEMLNASVLIMPSIWYEGFPMVLVEAFSCGLPVICSNIGSMAEIVEDGKTGLHFEKGDVADLRLKVNTLLSKDSMREEMGRRARKVFFEKYTEDINYKMLIDIYNEVIASAVSE